MGWRRVANNEKSKSAISQSILCGQKMISQQKQQQRWQQHPSRLCPLQKQQIENRTQINWIEWLSSMVTIGYKHTRTHRLCIIQHNWLDVICEKAATFFLFFSPLRSIPSLSWWCPFNNKFWSFLFPFWFQGLFIFCLLLSLDAFCRLDRDRNFQWCSHFSIHSSSLAGSILFLHDKNKLNNELNVFIQWAFLCLCVLAFLCNFLWISNA